MKKQLLIIISLVFLTGLSTFGQALHDSDPQPLVGCTTGPLNPLAGNSYNYSAVVNPTGGSFQWWATTDQNFIAGSANNISTMLLSPSTTPVGTDLLATSASYGVSSGTDNVDITWSTATLNTAMTTPTFVVVQYDGPTCSNNLKVFEIEPVNGFTVDILNLDATQNPLTYGTPFSTCVSMIESATYTAGAIVTDYGTNILYYEVVAANFTGSWTPDLAVTGLLAGQSAVVEWAYDLSFATVFGTGDPVSTTVTPTSDGVSIYVRVTVDNGTHEGLADVPITLTVNGTDSANNPDVINTDCANTSLTDDQAVQNLLARPTVTPGAGLNFVTP